MGATTEKHLGALYGGVTDGFATLHGLLDKVGKRLGKTVKLEREDNDLCYAGRRAAVSFNGKRVGWIGTPKIPILDMYKVPFPVTVFEIKLDI